VRRWRSKMIASQYLRKAIKHKSRVGQCESIVQAQARCIASQRMLITKSKEAAKDEMQTSTRPKAVEHKLCTERGS